VNQQEHNELKFISEILKVLFYNISSTELIEQANSFNTNASSKIGFNKVQLKKKLLDSICNLNSQQLDGSIDMLFDKFDTDTPTIFNILFYFADKIIERKNNRYCFRYEYTDIWREFSRQIDEEIIVTIAALIDALKRGIDKNMSLNWSYCIGCDNSEISALLKRPCVAIPIGVLMSATIEVAQLLTRRGLFEFDDIIYNSVGALIGFLLYLLLRKLGRRSE